MRDAWKRNGGLVRLCFIPGAKVGPFPINANFYRTNLQALLDKGGRGGVQTPASPGIWLRYVQEICSVLKKPMRACQSFKNLPFLKFFRFFSLTFSDTQFRRVVIKDPVFRLRWRNFMGIILIVNTLPTMHIVQYGQKSWGPKSLSQQNQSSERFRANMYIVQSRDFQHFNFFTSVMTIIFVFTID